MKMVITIVQDSDSADLVDELNDNGFRVTKLATTGGFLKAGNTTLMIGVEEENVQKVIDIIKSVCKKRDEITVSPASLSSGSDSFIQYPIKVEVGGATIFVIDVDQFIRV
ncbi:cyclic-di-AMP receptor [Clostridium sp. HCP1S3_B4]|uniref:cyclic-di-AMP receptor n=1 Tax=unclassified Clostridium TaxID=2614128 RepID=UPI001694A745|nr:cyclic-di-AMP receptor [Clostridiales bacterium]MDY2729387.1 cyclic-di-AMP receptor [Clostridium sp.]NLK22499.1 hypothetical protein [Clostridiales bacterium]